MTGLPIVVAFWAVLIVAGCCLGAYEYLRKVWNRLGE